MNERTSSTGAETGSAAITTTIVSSSMAMAFLDVDGTGTTALLEGDFSFDPANPFAVSVLFRTDGQSVQWTFGRELLVHGVYEPSGMGDVQLWPCLSDEGVAVVVIELNSPDGTVMVQAPTQEVSVFVQRMLAAVPLGEESALIDFDDELAALLA